MAHPDLDQLLSFCIPFAQDQLKKRDEFHPFAANILPDGTLNPVAIDEGGETPQPSVMIENFIALFHSLSTRGAQEAIAVCYDGRVTLPSQEKQDAITVFLEHSNGETVTIYMPYVRRKLLGYKFGDVIGVAADRRVFV